MYSRGNVIGGAGVIGSLGSGASSSNVFYTGISSGKPIVNSALNPPSNTYSSINSNDPYVKTFANQPMASWDQSIWTIDPLVNNGYPSFKNGIGCSSSIPVGLGISISNVLDLDSGNTYTIRNSATPQLNSYSLIAPAYTKYSYSYKNAPFNQIDWDVDLRINDGSSAPNLFVNFNRVMGVINKRFEDVNDCDIYNVTLSITPSKDNGGPARAFITDNSTVIIKTDIGQYYKIGNVNNTRGPYIVGYFHYSKLL